MPLVCVAVADTTPLSSQLIVGDTAAEARVVRVMPNTPCLVREMAGAVCGGRWAEPGDVGLVSNIFKPMGLLVPVGEGQMDGACTLALESRLALTHRHWAAVTGLSGSGPAYIFLLIEALSDGAVRNGLPRTVATQLAAQMVKGAAAMVLETGKHMGELKDMVCSPGGTTIAGVHALESGGVRGAVMDAVTAATKRSAELREAEARKAAKL